MTVTAKWYGLGLTNCLGGDVESETPAIDLLTNTIKIALIHSTYTPQQDTDEFFSTAQTYECVTSSSNSGYTAGGKTLAHKVVAYDTGTNIVNFDNTDDTDTTWTITGSFDTGKVPHYAVIYKWTGSAATSQLLGYIDFGADVQVTNADFKITMDAAGILKITAA